MLKQNIKRICLFLIIVTVALTGCSGKKKENPSSKNKQTEIITEKPDDDTYDGEIDFSELEDDEETPFAVKQEDTGEETGNHTQGSNVESTDDELSDEKANDKQEEPSSPKVTKDSEGYYNNVVKP